MPMEAFDQIRVEDECNDYKLGHSAGACVHQDICDEDEYIQYYVDEPYRRRSWVTPSD
jgi:hypothetical protein